MLFVASAVVTALVTTTLSRSAAKIGGYAITLAVNFGLYVAAFRFLTSATIPTRCLWLGAGVGAVFLEILQLVGGIYVKHVVTHASETYGTFATVIGLLVWLHLIAQLTLYAAEINVVVVRRLWPRSLLGPPDEPADQRDPARARQGRGAPRRRAGRGHFAGASFAARVLRSDGR